MNNQIPPQAIDAEKAVLGAMMMDNGCIPPIADLLTVECFYKTVHQKVFRAMMNLYNANEKVDQLTVAHELGKDLADVGGNTYLVELADSVPSVANIESYLGLVHETSIKRQALVQLIQAQRNIWTNEPWETIEEQVGKISTLGLATKGDEPVSDSMHRLLKRIEEGPEKCEGLKSGLSELDEQLGGFQPGKLIIVAARPSMGKTALMVRCAVEIAVVRKRPAGIITVEMSIDEIGGRCLAIMARANLFKLLTGRLDENGKERTAKAAGIIAGSPLYWTDKINRLGDICAKAREWRRKRDIQILFVDYLQLLELPEKDTRNNELGKVTRRLKWLAKELNIPVVALSQLSRAAEGCRPNLSHLRDSGEIENDADIVLFPYRADRKDKPGEGVIIIDKHRNGPTGEVKVTFQTQWAGFENPVNDVPF